MNRIHLFKGLTKQTHETVIGYLTDHSNESSSIRLPSSGDIYEVYPISIGYFTGRLDNNSEPLFEQDVILTPTGIFVIVFESSGFRCQPIDRNGESLPLSVFSDIKLMNAFGKIIQTNSFDALSKNIIA